MSRLACTRGITAYLVKSSVMFIDCFSKLWARLYRWFRAPRERQHGTGASRYEKNIPPLMSTLAPVTKLDAGDAR